MFSVKQPYMEYRLGLMSKPENISQGWLLALWAQIFSFDRWLLTCCLTLIKITSMTKWHQIILKSELWINVWGILVEGSDEGHSQKSLTIREAFYAEWGYQGDAKNCSLHSKVSGPSFLWNYLILLPVPAPQAGFYCVCKTALKIFQTNTFAGLSCKLFVCALGLLLAHG